MNIQLMKTHLSAYLIKNRVNNQCGLLVWMCEMIGDVDHRRGAIDRAL